MFNASTIKAGTQSGSIQIELCSSDKSSAKGEDGFYKNSKASTCLNEQNNNQIFESINMLGIEENENLDLSRLEQESNRLMESIAQMDLKE